MTLLILGILFLIGLVADVVGRLTPMPRVTLLLVSGVLVGPSGFQIVPEAFVENWFPMLTDIALAMIGFLLGQKLSVSDFVKRGNISLSLAVGKVLGAALAVFFVTWIVSDNLPLALALAGIATATAPAATFDVAHEIHAHGEFADNLLSIVAIDDALGLIVFSILLAFAVSTGADVETHLFTVAVLEVISSLGLGAVLGVPMAYLTGRLTFGERQGEPIQAEAFGFVLTGAGAALLLDLSPILTAMAMGSVVASLAEHHSRPFHAIEGIEWPFMIMFFVLAGASLVVPEVGNVGWLMLAYLAARGVGTYIGTYGTAALLSTDAITRRWMGLALMPQAGVALGMALIASQRLPEHGDVILTLILTTTIVLELTSPILTRRVLLKAADAESTSDG